MEILVLMGIGFILLSLIQKTISSVDHKKDHKSLLHSDDEIWDEIYDDTDDADEGDGDDN